MARALFPPAIFLMGPTGIGKTALALELHDALPVQLISVDSSQVYRGMDIGTAKPTAAEQARAPHRLIDIRDPVEPYSAAQFCVDALREMQSITRTGGIPLLVGGTMFYFQALERGLSTLPGASSVVRARISKEAAHTGWPQMHQRLAERDPGTAKRIDPHDAQRIQRALEVYEVTGASLSQLAGQGKRSGAPYRFIKIGLFPADRAALHARIAQRFNTMLERGLIAEVEQLYRRGDLNADLPSMRTVGYRQAWRYLTNEVKYNEMIEQSIIATRQLAKRQLTWLRHYLDVQRIEVGGDPPLNAVVDLLGRAI